MEPLTPEQAQAGQRADAIMREMDDLRTRAMRATGEEQEQLVAEWNALRAQMKEEASKVPSVISGPQGQAAVAQAKAAGYAGDDIGEAAEWVAAKRKGLDMSQEARMQRARDMGFDNKVYHQTKRENVDSILSDGFDLDRATHSGFETAYPYGVFTKSTNKPLSIDRGKSIQQMELVHNISDYQVKTFQNREAAEKYMRSNVVGWDELNDAVSVDARQKLQQKINRDFGHWLKENGLTHSTVSNADMQRHYFNPLQEEMKKLSNKSKEARRLVNRHFEKLGIKGVRIKQDQGNFETTDNLIILNPSNIRSVNAAFDPDNAASSSLLAGFRANALSTRPAIAGGIGGALVPLPERDYDGDGDIDRDDMIKARAAAMAAGAGIGQGAQVLSRNALAGIGARPVTPQQAQAAARGNSLKPPPSRSTIQPDDMGFITSAERAFNNPPKRFKDAKALTPDQWRNLFRDGGAGGEAFEYQIEPALRSIGAKPGERIPRDVMQRALGENRVNMSVSSVVEDDYSGYIAYGPASNYKQEVITLPAEHGKGYKSHNWEAENPVGHIRTTDRVSADGQRFRMVEELQSDLHQEGAKHGYYRPGQSNVKSNQLAVDRAESRFNEWQRSLPDNHPDKRLSPYEVLQKSDDATGRELARTLKVEMDRADYSQPAKVRLPPDAPLKRWERPFVRRAVQQAAKDGHDLIAFPRHETLHEALQTEGTRKFYDERLPQTVKAVAKELGGTVERVKYSIGKEEADKLLSTKSRQFEADWSMWKTLFKNNPNISKTDPDVIQLRQKIETTRRLIERLNKNEPIEILAIRLPKEAQRDLTRRGVVMHGLPAGLGGVGLAYTASQQPTGPPQ